MKKNNLKKAGGLLLILMILTAGCDKKENEVVTYEKEGNDYVEMPSNKNEEIKEEDVSNEKQDNNKVDNNNTVSNKTESNKNSNSQNKENNTTKAVTVRTYRFFGYIESAGPDMYTTLKLYSNNKYELYINVCSGVYKTDGSYNETDKEITLTGKENLVFTKKDNGSSLGFDNEKFRVCNGGVGNFAVESDILGSKITDDINTKTYRFFGSIEGAEPDMYTTLKLHSNNKYELFVNNCHGVTRYYGEYKATDKEIILTGEKNMSFTKNDDGYSLEFNDEELGGCNKSTGIFALEKDFLYISLINK